MRLGSCPVFLVAFSLAAGCSEDPVAPTETPDTGEAPAALPDADEPPPIGAFGLSMVTDGVTRIGVASVDITPLLAETFTDLDGDAMFDGCMDDPQGAGPGCEEPFDDVNGDGHFDAVWIGGFGTHRAAAGVHDPLTVRSMVIARDGEYLVLTGMDLVGLLGHRIDQARDRLVAEDGMEAMRLVAASSHNHQGPDVFGIWGFIDLESGHFESGVDPVYQSRVVDGIVESVRLAAAAVQPVEVVMGMVDMAGRSEWFDGRQFGGQNPKPWLHGLIDDRRDPVLAATQVFVMHARDPATGAGVGTLLNFSSHPETWGGSNDQISADWVGVARDRIDAALGGTTVFMAESLGGMQSMLGASIPLVDDDGEWIFDGEEPVWAPDSTWEYVHSAGVHVGDAALDAVAAGEVVTLDPIEVRWQAMPVLVDNANWSLGALLGVADMGPPGMIDNDPETCPGLADHDRPAMGCVPAHTWRLRLGPLAVITAPGELLPEIFHGFPDDPRWAQESADPTLRGTQGERDSAYFPQHPAACDTVPYEECRVAVKVGDCSCLAYHDRPYDLSDDPAVPPLRALLSSDTTYRIAMSAVGTYLSYIVPSNDFNLAVDFLSGQDGDHYEDAVSASSLFGSTLQEAQLQLGDDNAAAP